MSELGNCLSINEIQIGPPLRAAWSATQGLGLVMGGMRLVEPYGQAGISIDQAQTISAIRGMRFAATTFAVAEFGRLGFWFGGGPSGVPFSLVTAGVGAVVVGRRIEDALANPCHS